MKAFTKTLFGDARNAAAVACILAIAAIPTVFGHPQWAVLAMPLAGLGAVAWLARH